MCKLNFFLPLPGRTSDELMDEPGMSHSGAAKLQPFHLQQLRNTIFFQFSSTCLQHLISYDITLSSVCKPPKLPATSYHDDQHKQLQLRQEEMKNVVINQNSHHKHPVYNYNKSILLAVLFVLFAMCWWWYYSIWLLCGHSSSYYCDWVDVQRCLESINPSLTSNHRSCQKHSLQRCCRLCVETDEKVNFIRRQRNSTIYSLNAQKCSGYCMNEKCKKCVDRITPHQCNER